MDELPVTRKKKHTAAYYSALALIGAAVLTALGIIQERFLALPRGNRVQLTMVCVSGFSWDRVIPLHQGGRLPFLARLFRGKGSYGDSISYTSDTDPAIVASLFTGRFPAKHAMYREEDFTKLLACDSFQTPVWQELAARGQQCVVVGLPVSEKQASPDTSAAPRGIKKSGDSEMTAEYLYRITRGANIPGELLALLQECINSDLERLRQAVTALGANNSTHLFAYFQGLGRWQQRLTAQAGAMQDTTRTALIDNYYIFIDSILGQLYRYCRSNGIFIVLSERGTMQVTPRHGNYFPTLKEHPATGFFYATGLHIREGIDPLVLAPADLVPMLLYLTGNPLVNTLDGRVNFKLLEEHYYFKRKIIANTRLFLK